MGIVKNTLLTILILQLLSVVFFYYVEDYAHERDFTFLLYFCLSSIIFFILINLGKKPQVFNPSNFFLIGFIIVHFQLYVEYSLGNYLQLGHNYFLSISLLNQGLLISSAALISYFIGYTIYKYSKPKQVSSRFKPIISSTDVRFARRISFTLVCIYLLSTPMDFYFKGGYKSVNGVEVNQANAVSALSYELLIYAIILYITLFTLKNKNTLFPNAISFLKTFRLYYVFTIGVMMALFLIAGDRGPVIQIALAVFFSYVILSKFKIRLVPVLIIGYIGLLIISYNAHFREIKREVSFLKKIELTLERKRDSKRENTFSPNTLELAVSVRSFHGALLFTNNIGHTYGGLQLFQFAGSIPGGRKLIINSLGVDPNEINSAKLLTLFILGSDADHGLGTTAVADVYMDFGLIGVILIFGFVGFTFKEVYTNLTKNNSPKIISGIVFFTLSSLSLYLGRSALSGVFKPIVMMLVLFYVIRFLIYILKKPNESPLLHR